MSTDEALQDLSWSIVPNSTQLNAEQLLGGPLTITVSEVSIGTDEQPVSIHYHNDDGRPYKPCRTMRKLLIFAWGEDGRAWIGRSMTLYNDPKVRFGGMEVGGIRISHLSDIQAQIRVALTATKGKKALYTVDPLVIERKPDAAPAVDHLVLIAGAETAETLKAAFQSAWQATRDKALREDYKRAYDARLGEISGAV